MYQIQSGDRWLPLREFLEDLQKKEKTAGVQSKAPSSSPGGGAASVAAPPPQPDAVRPPRIHSLPRPVFDQDRGFEPARGSRPPPLLGKRGQGLGWRQFGIGLAILLGIVALALFVYSMFWGVLPIPGNEGRGDPSTTSTSQGETESMDREFAEALKLFRGDGVAQDSREAVVVFQRLAQQGHVPSQFCLGWALSEGQGVPKDSRQAIRWITKSAEQGHPGAQWWLGCIFASGEGKPQDTAKAFELFTKSAEQGFAPAQYFLGIAYEMGDGVPADVIQSHCWYNLAGAAGVEEARSRLTALESTMSREQISEAEQMAAAFAPRKAIAETTAATPENIFNSRPLGHGTGFFVTNDGFLVTNFHVVREATEVRVNTGKGIKVAKVVNTSPQHDLALLKVEGDEFEALPIASSSDTALGSTVATVGFPNYMLMGLSPKLAKGEIGSLAGIKDDATYFQISVPVQPGNSGGALVNESGNVVGIVSAKLDAAHALVTSGALPENVNYAVKSDYLLALLDATPEFTGKTVKTRSGVRKFQDVVKEVENASVLILVY